MKYLLGLIFFLGSASVNAHRPSDAYLDLQVDGARVEGHWQIALRDLELAVGVDDDGDGAITWGELDSAAPRIRAALGPMLRLGSAGQDCDWRPGELLVNDRSDGTYAWLALSAVCAQPLRQLQVSYHLLFDLDPSHRGLLVLRSGDHVQQRVFSPSQAQLVLDLQSSSGLETFRDYLVQGVWHIWIGLDHILFLLALLLPAVLRREAGVWKPQPNLRSVLWPVVTVVSAFTFAHSLTLSAAVLEWLHPDARWVEVAIAASVVLAALNNLTPLTTRRRWAVALVFGLIHGFGFASVLADLGLPQEQRVLALVAFNLGVEVGQLAIVAATIPLIYWLRNWRGYPVLMRAGSLAVAALALTWLWERIPG